MSPMILPPRLLFACHLNSVRSPMAAGLFLHLTGASPLAVEAAGVQAEPINGFAVAVMQELGVDLSGYIAKTLYDLPRAAPFDLTIALAPAALAAVQELPRSFTGEVLFWDVLMPQGDVGHRERQLSNYRTLRDDLRHRIVTHFSL